MGDMNLHIAAVLIGLFVWLWLNFSKARELVIRRASLACKQQDVQLLDQSVTLRTVTLRRDAQDNYRFLRGYQFDFSLDGYDRYPAYIILFGKTIERIQFDHPDGSIIMNDESVSTLH